MKLIQIIFCIYIYMKQFYFFSSGGLQPADFIFIFAFILYIMQCIRKNKLPINNIDKIYLVFLFILITINLIYSMVNQTTEFLLPCMFYSYNLMIIILFRELIKENLFLKRLLNTFKLSIITQLIIYMLGMGRWYGGERYMGTFNDPNQMGFYVLISFLTIVVLDDLLRSKKILLYYIITLFLIVKTSSTGMLLGIMSFTIVNIIFKVKSIIIKYKIINKRNILKSIVIMSIISLFIIPNFNIILSQIQNLSIVDRVEEKLSEISSNNKREDEESIIRDRGIDKLLLYPEYMLIGAGEGKYSRFNMAYHVGEIHSTLFSILFYYGIVPTALVVLWILKNILYIPKHIYSIYIALFIESLVLLNQRQATFWMIFILGSLYTNKHIKN